MNTCGIAITDSRLLKARDFKKKTLLLQLRRNGVGVMRGEVLGISSELAAEHSGIWVREAGLGVQG